VLSASSSSRRDDFRLGLDKEVVEALLRDFLREMVDSFSSSAVSLRLGFETSEPAFDRPEPDRPKLNMMATSDTSGGYHRSVWLRSCGNLGIVVFRDRGTANYLRRVANAVANR